MIINHNIAAMNTYRQLTINNSNTSKSLEKLSSGLRINRAGDDAAGLAISEKMRAQIRGLDQASRNSQDAISLIQTAEGAMSETHSILQRMRELAVQASSDTNTEDDRKTIQQEINQLTSEVNRIGKTTEFNTKKLLNGDASNTFTVTGTSFGSGATTKALLGGTGTLTTGSGALTTGTYKVTISKTTSGVPGASGGQFFDGSQKVVGTVADVGYAGTPGTKPTFSGSKIHFTSGAATSGYLKTGASSGTYAIWNSGGNLIVSGSNSSGVTLKDVVTADSSGHFSYNNGGVMFSVTSISGWNSGSANRVSGHFSGGGSVDLGTQQDYFTAVTGSGGKNAATALGSGVTLDSISGGLKAGHYKIKIDFTNNSGKITVTGSGASGNFITDGISGIASGTTAAHYNAFGLDFKVDFTKFNSGSGSATLEFDVEDQTKWTTDVDTYKAVVTNSSGNAVASGTIGKSASYQSGSAAAGLSGAASVDIGGLHLAFASGASPTASSGTFNVDATTSGEDDSLTFQIGANEHQSLNLSIGDVQSVALGISSTAGGSGFSSGRAVTDGTNADNIEYALDVTTTESAAKAITTLDNAINKVSTERSKLGAVQNRLEHTINNLGTSSENLSAAESRIRDVDMAKTMMDFTKNNILTQAAQAMLAQANQQPQGVLQLLR